VSWQGNSTLIFSDDGRKGITMTRIDSSGFSAIGSASPEQLRSAAEALSAAHVPALLASHFMPQGHSPSVTDPGTVRGGMPLSPPSGASLTPFQLAQNMRALTATANQYGGGPQWAQAVRDALQAALSNSPGGLTPRAPSDLVAFKKGSGIQTGSSARNRVVREQVRPHSPNLDVPTSPATAHTLHAGVQTGSSPRNRVVNQGPRPASPPPAVPISTPVVAEHINAGKGSGIQVVGGPRILKANSLAGGLDDVGTMMSAAADYASLTTQAAARQIAA
jgi:hypothetical protein